MKRETVKQQIARLKEFFIALDEFFEDVPSSESNPSYTD